MTFLCISLVLSFAGDAQSQRRQGRPKRIAINSGKSARKSLYLGAQSVGSDYEVPDEVENIISSSTNQEIYDPFTILQWRRLKERAQPSWEEDDFANHETRTLVEKAFAVQMSNSLLPVIKRSELRNTYRATEKGIKSFRDTMRYELKDSGTGLTTQSKSPGKRLIQFDFNLNPDDGLNPLLRLGDSFRFRYDPFQQRTLLEFGMDF